MDVTNAEGRRRRAEIVSQLSGRARGPREPKYLVKVAPSRVRGDVRPQSASTGLRLDPAGVRWHTVPMSKLEAIEAEVRKLPAEQALQLQDWLADYLEDEAELNPEFVASIERGQADLREGRVRVKQA